MGNTGSVNFLIADGLKNTGNGNMFALSGDHEVDINLDANDPYNAIKTKLEAEINQEAWETLNSDTSQAFYQAEV